MGSLPADLNSLLFENDNGEAVKLYQKELEKLIFSTMPKLDLVFVAACQSEFMGEIFAKCEAKHVICVK